jgi:hypothetical protein
MLIADCQPMKLNPILLMAQERVTTDNLVEGVATIRWDDDEARLRALHPESYVRAMPGVGAPLVIRDLMDGFEPVQVHGYVFFGPEGVKSVVLVGESESDKEDVRPCVQTLAKRFGFGPVTESKRQRWDVSEVQVLFQLMDAVEMKFYLRVNRPGLVQPDFRIFDASPHPGRRAP